MGSKEPSILAQLSQQCLADSDRWFGDSEKGITQSISYNALCLAGEVGELCNIIKKIERGSLDPHAEGVHFSLAMETTDVLIYLLNIGGLLGIDLLRAYEVKRVENDARFTKQRKDREAARRQKKAMANGE